jgi:hypothetical protein
MRRSRAACLHSTYQRGTLEMACPQAVLWIRSCAGRGRRVSIARIEEEPWRWPALRPFSGFMRSLLGGRNSGVAWGITGDQETARGCADIAHRMPAARRQHCRRSQLCRLRLLRPAKRRKCVRGPTIEDDVVWSDSADARCNNVPFLPSRPASDPPPGLRWLRCHQLSSFTC